MSKKLEDLTPEQIEMLRLVGANQDADHCRAIPMFSRGCPQPATRIEVTEDGLGYCEHHAAWLEEQADSVMRDRFPNETLRTGVQFLMTRD